MLYICTSEEARKRQVQKDGFVDVAYEMKEGLESTTAGAYCQKIVIALDC